MHAHGRTARGHRGGSVRGWGRGIHTTAIGAESRVNGIDLLLGYLEHLATNFEAAAQIRNLSVRFLKFVEVGETVTFHIEDRDGDTLHGKVSVGGVDVAVIAAALAAEAIPPQAWSEGAEPAPLKPAEFAQYIAAEIARWKAVAKTADIKPD